ncbi:MAG TPA: hypothetical protein VIJ57_10080, partial [Hanamia sp.]
MIQHTSFPYFKKRKYQALPVKSFFLILTTIFFSVFLSGCKTKNELPPVFELRDDTQTGLHFENKLTPTQEFNIFKYL